jgi:hypothetical protein
LARESCAVRASPSLVVNKQSKCGERLICWRATLKARRLRSALFFVHNAVRPASCPGRKVMKHLMALIIATVVPAGAMTNGGCRDDVQKF